MLGSLVWGVLVLGRGSLCRPQGTTSMRNLRAAGCEQRSGMCGDQDTIAKTAAEAAAPTHRAFDGPGTC